MMKMMVPIAPAMYGHQQVKSGGLAHAVGERRGERAGVVVRVDAAQVRCHRWSRRYTAAGRDQAHPSLAAGDFQHGSGRPVALGEASGQRSRHLVGVDRAGEIEVEAAAAGRARAGQAPKSIGGDREVSGTTRRA
jgi:hypothetical protein